MCFESTCQHCKKSTWAGCGAHLQSVFRDIPMEKRCFCGYTQEELELETKNPKYPNVGPVPKDPRRIKF
jgi:hypothetical protein